MLESVRQSVKLMIRLSCIVLLIILELFPALSFGKRGAPKPVPPIVQNGIRYSAPNGNGLLAMVIASDAKTGKELWRVTIFETKIEPLLEEDAQLVFITRLGFKCTSLGETDEKSRC